MTLEIVAQSVEDALTAERAGADRLELVSALSLGGLTPSIGTLELILAQCRLPVATMLRPRSGGFAYGSSDLDPMIRDGERFRSAGAQALVFGVLTPEGALNLPANARLVAIGAEAVFHRAFDVLPDPRNALDALVDLGFRRILTSGGLGNAPDNLDGLKRLVEWADGRIEILAGGSVRASNVAEIVARSGVTQVHLAGQEWTEDRSSAKAVFNGPAHPEDSYGCVAFAKVNDVRRIIGS